METWLSFAGGVILLLLGAAITKLTAIKTLEEINAVQF